MKKQNWSGASGASTAALERLVSVAPFLLPERYLDFLSKFNGGQGSLNIQPCWLCLHPAEEVIEIQLDGTHHEFFPDYMIIGSNGGGEDIAFDLDDKGNAKVVYFDTTNIDIEESVQPLASSFGELITLLEMQDN